MLDERAFLSWVRSPRQSRCMTPPRKIRRKNTPPRIKLPAPPPRRTIAVEDGEAVLDLLLPHLDIRSLWKCIRPVSTKWKTRAEAAICCFLREHKSTFRAACAVYFEGSQAAWQLSHNCDAWFNDLERCHSCETLTPPSSIRASPKASPHTYPSPLVVNDMSPILPHSPDPSSPTPVASDAGTQDYSLFILHFSKYDAANAVFEFEVRETLNNHPLLALTASDVSKPAYLVATLEAWRSEDETSHYTVVELRKTERFAVTEEFQVEYTMPLQTCFTSQKTLKVGDNKMQNVLGIASFSVKRLRVSPSWLMSRLTLQPPVRRPKFELPCGWIKKDDSKVRPLARLLWVHSRKFYRLRMLAKRRGLVKSENDPAVCAWLDNIWNDDDDDDDNDDFQLNDLFEKTE